MKINDTLYHVIRRRFDRIYSFFRFISYIIHEFLFNLFNHISITIVLKLLTLCLQPVT